MNYTLHELLNEHIVIIPQIQRDYAQGRDEQLDLRKAFIKKIKESLGHQSTALNLDFIYGYTRSISNNKTSFIPLDGQQRLTTLWLIHWFVAPVEVTSDGNNQQQILKKSAIDVLASFTYQTRLSSKRFCYNLVHSPLIINPNKKISFSIKDAAWYMAEWNNDPTIVSMLNSLDTIQQEGFSNIQAWDSLVSNKKVTFDYIDIKSDEFKLTDELYIKMNSRGKPLTPFENFKAQFSELLSSKQNDFINNRLIYNDAEVTYQEYFAFKIDSVWMDLFWGYRSKNNSVDSQIMNFIYFIAEFLYLKHDSTKTTTDIKHDFEFLGQVFSKKKNVDFLFSSLNIISGLSNVEDFFKKLLQKISSFDSSTKDYFRRSISNTAFEVKDKILLYAILAYCIETNTNTPTEDLQDFTRIVRNLLLSVRQPNKSNRVEYTTNLRLPNVNEYCKFIDNFITLSVNQPEKTTYQILADNDFIGFNKDYIQSEKIKAGIIVENGRYKSKIFDLEEHKYVQGNTINFTLNSRNLDSLAKSFNEVWSPNIDDSLIIRAMLSVGDYSVMTHEKSSLGGIWYFGCKDHWNRILTTTDKKERSIVSPVLNNFLEKYLQANGNDTVEKLQILIDDYVNKTTTKDWVYYFVKYAAITGNGHMKLNVFAWNDENGFDIYSLGNSGQQPLHSYHINPYLAAVADNYRENNKISISWDRFTNPTSLRINKKLSIKFGVNGWKIYPYSNHLINDTIKSKFKLEADSIYYILKETGTKDKIETATEFIDYILNE